MGSGREVDHPSRGSLSGADGRQQQTTEQHVPQHVDLPLLLEAIDGPMPGQGHDPCVEDTDGEGPLTPEEGLRCPPDRVEGGQVEDQ